MVAVIRAEKISNEHCGKVFLTLGAIYCSRIGRWLFFAYSSDETHGIAIQPYMHLPHMVFVVILRRPFFRMFSLMQRLHGEMHILND